ncbi:PEP-utilizing enzyme [Actinomadura madurae]|nr:PEP-utilizing enzyme [Actinomadura madurae]MCP9971856.1 PEP-utilizing enzyme [Actinomadura madurae]
MLTGTIAPLVRRGATVAGSRADEARAAEEARRRLRAACRNPARRAVLHALLSLMRWFVRAREDTRFCRTQLFGLSREVLWRLGAELAAAGALDEAMDVLDLTADEVTGAFDGTLPGADLRGLAAVRRAERVRHLDVPLPPALFSVPAGRPVAAALAHARPVGPRPAADGGDVLRGLGSSGGTVRGRAKVVLDPGIAPAGCAGRILVARETDPGWLSLMIAASGLVVERGTLLSHTAVTGRLLGVPTAVAVGGAVARIPDGAWIELDGRAGTVRVLDERATR